MSTANRVLALLLIAALLALAALLFGPTLLSVVFAPLAEQLWIFLRVCVLCINQDEFWSYTVLVLFVFLCYRLFRALAAASRDSDPAGANPERNAALGELEHWRYLFAKPPRDERERGLARRELAWLLLSAYSARNRVESGFELLESFRSGRIPLPAAVHELLFGEASGGRPPKGLERLRAWLRRASGREGADDRRAIEEYLRYLESHMEIKDDER